MKQKMIIYMSKLSVGGMEKSLINLINQSNFTKDYDVTLYALYSKEESYLKELESKVNVKLLWHKEWNILGKLVCSAKMLKDLILLKLRKNKYDVAICYPYQHQILSILTRSSSKNSIIFIHSNISLKYGNQIEKHKKKIRYDKFAKVVCVSNNALDNFKKLYPNYKGKSITINNYINGSEIIELSKEKIDDLNIDNITFINIARHEDESKKITRIINASNKLKKENYQFKVLLVGDGKDHQMYQELINKYKLQKEVILLGKKTNPYPYLKLSDCLIMSSQYEGYGIVLDEARILNKPFITTDVADAKLITTKGYGILCDNSQEGIYNGMKEFLDKGYTIKNKFDYQEFNKQITNLLDEIVKE